MCARTRKSTMQRDTSAQSLMEGRHADAVLPRPFGERPCDAVKGHVSRRTFVTRLFRDRGPSHIPRLVVPVVVWEAVDRMLRRRTRPDIRKERLKGVAPAVAHANATAAIQMEVGPVWVIAPTFNALPYGVLGRPVLAFRTAVTSIPARGRVASMAAARVRVSRSQRRDAHRHGSTAITQAYHLTMPLASWRDVRLSLTNDSQSPELVHPAIIPCHK